ncbi:MAG: hypothetical protein H0U85_05935 [Gemmatimonadales bacterium]|nr:hypothetical protein [Gemmatimonadales bacterium]
MRTPKLSGLTALAIVAGLGACSKTTVETPAPATSTGATVSTTTTTTTDTTARRDTAGYSASGNANANAGTTTTSTTVTTPSGTMSTSGNAAGSMGAPGAHTYSLASANNSGFTGNVTLTDMGNKTRVAMTLNAPANTKASSDHNAAIHTGTCAAPGAKVVGLHDVEGNGKAASTELDIMMSTIMNGQHIVVAKENPGDRVVACVAIPSM